MLTILKITETVAKWTNDFKEFMMKHDRSPLIYGGFFLIGLAIFAIAYDRLHKEK